MEIKEWFKHSYIASTTGRLDNLRFFGAEAIGLYWIIIEELYQRQGAGIEKAVLERKARALQCRPDTLQALIDEDALQEEAGIVFSLRVQEELSQRIEKKESISKARSEAGKKGMQNRWHGNENPPKTGDNKTITKPDFVITNVTNNNQREKESKNNNILGSNTNRLPSDCIEGDCKGEDMGTSIEMPELLASIRYNDIQEYWNETAAKAGLPKCTALSDKRRKAIKACVTAYGLDKVKEACDTVAESDFLSGRDGKWGGCSFDWVFITGNMLKVLEGNYKNDRRPAGGLRTSAAKRNIPTDLNGQYDDEDATEVTEL